MFIRRKRHRSDNIGVIVVEKNGGKMKELATIGVADDENEANNLANRYTNRPTRRMSSVNLNLTYSKEKSSL